MSVISAPSVLTILSMASSNCPASSFDSTLIDTSRLPAARLLATCSACSIGAMMLLISMAPNQAARIMPAATTLAMVMSMMWYQDWAAVYSALATSSCRVTSSVILLPMGSIELYRAPSKLLSMPEIVPCWVARYFSSLPMSWLAALNRLVTSADRRCSSLVRVVD